jgi:DNA-binding response OmpR family regulator
MAENDISQAGGPLSAPLQWQTNPLHRILVVDDDDDIRRLNATGLVRSGYDVDTAEDGTDAWDKLQYHGYDLLVTDNKMPRMSGVELLKKLRHARIVLPVIMATGIPPREEFTRYPWLQPAATLIKPYRFEEMLRTVKKVLREADRTDIEN